MTRERREAQVKRRDDDTEMQYDAGLAEQSARPRAAQPLVLIEAVQISCAALSHSGAVVVLRVRYRGRPCGARM